MEGERWDCSKDGWPHKQLGDGRLKPLPPSSPLLAVHFRVNDLFGQFHVVYPRSRAKEAHAMSVHHSGKTTSINDDKNDVFLAVSTSPCSQPHILNGMYNHFHWSTERLFNETARLNVLVLITYQLVKDNVQTKLNPTQNKTRFGDEIKYAILRHLHRYRVSGVIV